MNKHQKDFVFLIIGAIFISLLLFVIGLVIGIPVTEHIKDNSTLILTILGGGGLLGKYLMSD